MKKKTHRNMLIVGGLVLLILLPLIIKGINKAGLQSSTVENQEPSIQKDMFETIGDYQMTDGQVIFDFQLVNHDSEAKELQFGSGQQFELVIKDEKNEEMYRYSDGKFFTMALVYKSIGPGGSLHWQDQWDMRDKEGRMVDPGRYQAEIEIMVIPDDDGDNLEERQLRTSVEFTLTGNELPFAKEDNEDHTGDEDPPSEDRIGEAGRIKGEAAKAIIAETANEVMHALGIKDADRLASYVHPEKGVRFTPYTYVDLEADIVFTPNEVRNFFEDQKLYLWGYYDGSGDEIRLTPGEYYTKFIYSADFINAEQIGYNEVLSSGNMLENQFEVYENPIIVEYYFSGFNPAYVGMDWQSLRLVFEEYENEWRLTGIIHNQWTI